MTADRAGAILKAPDPTVVTGDFPAFSLASRTTLHRAVGVDNVGNARSFGWFASKGQGRFDLAVPDGTYYTAFSEHTAARERLGAVLGARAAIPKATAETCFVVSLIVTADVDAADLTHKDAVDFKAYRELSTTSEYTITQAWAAHFMRVGFAAIHYASRFTSSTQPRDMAVAIFGPTGMHDGPIKSVNTPRCLADPTFAASIGMTINDLVHRPNTVSTL